MFWATTRITICVFFRVVQSRRSLCFTLFTWLWIFNRFNYFHFLAWRLCPFNSKNEVSLQNSIVIKKVLNILLAVLIANTLSWYFIGRDQTLHLALDFFDYFGPYSETDTLFIPSINFHIDSEGSRSEFGDLSLYSEKRQNRFIEKIKEYSGARHTIYLDSPIELFHDYEGNHSNLYFYSDIERNYPLYTSVYSGVTVYGYGASFSDKYIWFFKWWPLRIRQLGES